MRSRRETSIDSNAGGSLRCDAGETHLHDSYASLSHRTLETCTHSMMRERKGGKDDRRMTLLAAKTRAHRRIWVSWLFGRFISDR